MKNKNIFQVTLTLGLLIAVMSNLFADDRGLEGCRSANCLRAASPETDFNCEQESSSFFEQIQGKVDVGAAYLHIDVIKDNNTEKKMDMPALKADATVVVYEGWCFKPSLLYGSNQGDILTLGLGFGRCIPVTDRLVLTPTVGFSYTDLHTDLKDYNPYYQAILHFDTEFESTSPYISLDATYRIQPGVRLGLNYQYAWSRSHSTYKEKTFQITQRDKGNSSGSNYGGMLEYDLTDCWSINVGAAYNNSLSKEKDGLRGFGGKVGLVRWF